MTNQKQQVVDLLKATETGTTEPIGVIHLLYVCHNLATADGTRQPPGAPSRGTEGLRPCLPGRDYVFAHWTSTSSVRRAPSTSFRFDNGKTVEHSDNLGRSDPSGHTMIDGPAAATDLDRTHANNTLVRTFVEKHDCIHRVLGEGNFVLVLSQGLSAASRSHSTIWIVNSECKFY